MRLIRDLIAALILAGVLIFLAKFAGQRLGTWTDQMTAYHAMLVWLAWEALLLFIGISAVWLWRHHRPY
jgi:membrane protein DedA with SNARE-associated domain